MAEVAGGTKRSSGLGVSHRGGACPEPWQRWVQGLCILSGEHIATVTTSTATSIHTATIITATSATIIITVTTGTTPPIAACPHWDMNFFSVVIVVIALWWWLSLLAVFPVAQINLSLSQDNPCL